MYNNFSIPASTKSFACKPSVFKYQHLTMLAVKLQPETRIFIKQIIRLLIGRLVLLISRTPPHAVAQAVLGKHQRNIFPGRQFESRVNLFHPVVLVERTGFPVGDIPQIRQAAFRKVSARTAAHVSPSHEDNGHGELPTTSPLLYGAYRRAEKRERTSFQTNRPPPPRPRKGYSPT